MGDFVADVLQWIEDQPVWVRPALYGALLVPAWSIKRGALYILPIAGVLILFTHEHPFRAFGLLLLMYTLAVAGAALSGLAYSFVGSRVRGAPILGPYLAGWVSCWPYVLVILFILRLKKGTPLTTSFENAEWATLGFMTLWVGTLTGFFLFRDD
jgi:hypothetical protein